ncbi:MAG TPA: hypothetical protein VJN02_07745 [Gammaproteobacteria bacterium]|nr:hypothetical protein [Gammaproteobacteria bacterium]
MHGKKEILEYLLSKGAQLSQNPSILFCKHILYCICFIRDISIRINTLKWLLENDHYKDLQSCGVSLEHIRAALGEIDPEPTEEQPGRADCLGFTPYHYWCFSGCDVIEDRLRAMNVEQRVFKMNLNHKVKSGFYDGVNLAWILLDIGSQRLTTQLDLQYIQSHSTVIVDLDASPKDEMNPSLGVTLAWELIRSLQFTNFNILKNIRDENGLKSSVNFHATPQSKMYTEYGIKIPQLLASQGLSTIIGRERLTIYAEQMKLFYELLADYSDQSVDLNAYPTHEKCGIKGLSLFRMLAIYENFNLLSYILNHDLKVRQCSSLSAGTEKLSEDCPAEYNNNELDEILINVAKDYHLAKPLQFINLEMSIWNNRTLGANIDLIKFLILKNQWEILKNVLARDYYNRKLMCDCNSGKIAGNCDCNGNKHYYTGPIIDLNSVINSETQDTILVRLISQQQFGILDYLVKHTNQDVKINLNVKYPGKLRHFLAGEYLNRASNKQAKRVLARIHEHNAAITKSNKQADERLTRKTRINHTPSLVVQPVFEVEDKLSPEKEVQKKLNTLLQNKPNIEAKFTLIGSKKEAQIDFGGHKDDIKLLFDLIKKYNIYHFKLELKRNLLLTGKLSSLSTFLDNRKFVEAFYHLSTSKNAGKKKESSTIISERLSSSYSKPQEKIDTIILSLTDIQKQAWELVIRRAFCIALEISIDWDDKKGCFVIKLPEDSLFTLFKYNAKYRDKFIYKIGNSFIEDEILSRLKSKEIANITFDQVNLIIWLYPTVAVLSQPLHLDLHSQIYSVLKKKCILVSQVSDESKEEIEEEKQVLPRRKNIKKNQKQDNPDKQLLSIDVFYQIKQLFQAISPEASFGFLLPNNIKREKEDGWKLKYKYSGAPRIGRSDSVLYFRIMAHVLNSTQPSAQPPNPARIFPPFMSIHVERDIVQIVIHPGKSNNLMEGYFSPDLIKIFSQAIQYSVNGNNDEEESQSFKTGTLLQGKVEKNNVNDSIQDITKRETCKLFSFRQDQYSNLRYHIQKINKISCPNESIGSLDNVYDHTHEHIHNVIYYCSYSFHLLQVFRLLGNSDEECYQLRNTLRHHFHKTSWASIYRACCPLIESARNAIKTHDTYAMFFKIEQEEQLRLIVGGIPSIDDLKISDDSKMEIVYRATLESISSYQGCDEKQEFENQKRDAILHIYSWIGEINKNDLLAKYVFQTIGHVESDQSFEKLAENLYRRISDANLNQNQRCSQPC